MKQTGPDTLEDARPDGSPSEVELSRGTIRYRDTGDGHPIVFLHGVLTNGTLWRDVTGPLSREHRCLAPTFPLGGHDVGMHPDADLSPPGLVALLEEFVDALGLDRVTLVANDLGGALCQMFVAEYPERVTGLVLTNCNAFDNYPPTLVSPLVRGAHVPGFTTVLARTLGVTTARRLTVELFANDPISPAVVAGYLDSLQTTPAVRRDLRKVLRGSSPRYTNAAAEAFPSFERPVLVAWGVDDPVFPIEDAERLVERFPNARLERVEGSRLLVPEDRPERLVELVPEVLDSGATV